MRHGSPPTLSSHFTMACCSHSTTVDYYLFLKFTPELYQVIHHVLSLVSVVYAMLSGEGQLYAFMVLISETTTPGINLRW
jgi:hypothetical protein